MSKIWGRIPTEFWAFFGAHVVHPYPSSFDQVCLLTYANGGPDGEQAEQLIHISVS